MKYVLSIIVVLCLSSACQAQGSCFENAAFTPVRFRFVVDEKALEDYGMTVADVRKMRAQLAGDALNALIQRVDDPGRSEYSIARRAVQIADGVLAEMGLMKQEIAPPPPVQPTAPSK